MIGARRAELSDIAALRPMAPPRALRAYQTQVLNGPAVTVLDDGAPLAIAGVYWVQDHFEAWFMAARTLKGSPRAARVIKLLSLLVLALPEDAAVIAYVARDNPQAQRLARLCGFQPAGLAPGNRIAFVLNRAASALRSPPRREEGAI